MGIGIFDYRYLRRVDWILLIVVTLLAVIGVMTLVSANRSAAVDTPYYVRQATFFFMGLAIALALACVDLRFLVALAPLAYIVPIGVLVAGLDALLGLALPPAVASALDIAFLALLTGGLHLDGLADAADGLLGGREREERLALMRDGRVGAFGAAALVLVLMVEVAALASLAPAARAAALVAACTLARWSMSLAVWGFPYARSSGAGAAFKSGLAVGDALVATAIAAAVAALVAGAMGLGLLAGAAALTAALGAYASRRLGGLTGDVYGAVGEIAFASTLVAWSGLPLLAGGAAR